MEERSVHFTRLPISLPCPVPVVPGTPQTMRDGEPLPDEERTERCAVDAFWMIGMQVVCDVHLREACELLQIDFDDLVLEAAQSDVYEMPATELLERWRETIDRPWADRYRYAQEDVHG